jgi:glutathione S-transferase
VRTPPSERRSALIEASVRDSEALFSMLDAHLASQPYMAGQRFTMADIPVGCEAHRWFNLPAAEYRRPNWPNVERWYSELLSRPGTRGVLDLPLE